MHDNRCVCVCVCVCVYISLSLSLLFLPLNLDYLSCEAMQQLAASLTVKWSTSYLGSLLPSAICLPADASRYITHMASPADGAL